jgi:tetratricopeptide (TPR) repeat protein
MRLFHLKYGRQWLWSGLIAAAALAAWWDSFSNPFVYDDFPSIFLNPTIQGGSSLRQMLSPPAQGGITVAGRPVLNATLAANWAWGGPEVRGFHVLNLGIHVAAGLLLFGLVRRTLSAGKPNPTEQRCSCLIAGASALWWTLHPVQTESVTYVIQRAESLMGGFYLLTLYAFLRGTQAARPRGWFAVAIAACALGMATKEVMVSAPVAVLAFDRTFLSGTFREAWKRHAKVYLLLAATWIPLALLVASTHGRGDGEFNPGVHLSRYLLTQPGAILHYLRLAAWPHPLIFEYGAEWVAKPLTVLPQALAVIFLITATTIAFWRWPRIGFLGGFFFAILAPTSFVPGARQTLAEHRMYLALAPVVVLAAWSIVRFGGRASIAIVLLLGCGLGVATAARNRDYRSGEILWGDTVAKRPGNPVARHNYGMALYQRGRLEEAATQYRAALALAPDYVKAHANLGATLLASGQVAAGIAEYERALSLRPDFEDAHFSLAEALAGSGQWVQAMEEYRTALRLAPEDAPAHLGLARVLAQSGQLDAGIAEATLAAKLDPDNAAPPLELGKMLAQEGRLPEAVPPLQRALQLDPGSQSAKEILARIQAYLSSGQR